MPKLKYLVLLFILFAILINIVPPITLAQTATCDFYSVSPALTDLGATEYLRFHSDSPRDRPLQYTYSPTGIIGGLYPGGSNIRPATHEAIGAAIAQQIQPLDINGNVNLTSGKIGFVSLGMSNTQSEFGRFISSYQLGNLSAPSQSGNPANDKMMVLNGALNGAVIERWVDPNNPFYNQTWTFFHQTINGREQQIQVVWVKVAQAGYQDDFPQSMYDLTDMYVTLMHELKTRLPNLKIAHMSSRTRSYSYQIGLSPEPTAFENGFAVRWLIERQLNGDPELNFNNPDLPINSAYITWGPYLWIDGENPRSDGRTWLSTDLTGDCTHPNTAPGTGVHKVAEMLWEFYSTDSTSRPWFMDANAPTPTPSPTASPTPTAVPTGTPTAIPTNTPTPTTGPTATPTPTYTSTPTATPTPTTTPTFTATPQPGSLISAWSFASSTLTDDLNGCTGCVNTGATWTSQGRVNGAFTLDNIDKLDLGSFPYLNGRAAYTVNLWVKPTFDETNLSTWHCAFSDGSNIIIRYVPNLRDWRTNLRTTNGSYFTDTQNLSWDPNTWHMLTATYNGSSLKIYWDGVFHTSRSATGAVFSDSGRTYLGYNGLSGTNAIYYSGDVDELTIYNQALDQSQITNLFLNP